jgi:site-specific recombinase XerD
MSRTQTAHGPTVAELVDEFRDSLRARNKSPKTIYAYIDTARRFSLFLGERSMPTAAATVTREHVEAFIVDQLDRWSASTAATRYRCLQQFFGWLVDDGEIAHSPMARMKPPSVAEAPVPVVSRDDLRALLKACDGRRFVDRRDTAIIRLFIDTGMRVAELTGVTVEDIDFDGDVALVIGKGRRPRACPFGAKAAQGAPPLPSGTSPQRLRRAPRPVAGREGPDDRQRHHPDARATLRPGRHRQDPPPPAAPHLRP